MDADNLFPSPSLGGSKEWQEIETIIDQINTAI